MLAPEESRPDPKNHCVPVITVIDDPEDDTKSYLVMPFLRPADDPPFDFVKEIVDFVDQILEVRADGFARYSDLILIGRAWSSYTGRGSLTGKVQHCIHAKRTHKSNSDCVMHNIMMDADAMYPEGFHPVKTTHKRDFSGWATYIPRSVAGVRYYFIDFGISVHLPGEDHNKLVTGETGRDQDPPELSPDTPYNPFKLDVFIIGNMFKQELCEVTIPLSAVSSRNSWTSRNTPMLSSCAPSSRR